VTPDDVALEPGSEAGKFKLDDALLDVMVHNKFEFVLLFLECGVNLKQFVKSQLYNLYEQVTPKIGVLGKCERNNWSLIW